MTFGAMASWQAWTLLLAAGALAAGLFLLKLRPPRILVPSLVLWHRVLDASPGLTRWERIRRAVSLAATVLLALLIGLAIARPAHSWGAQPPGRGRALIVLDSSWSMLARTPSGETRWERALQEARRIAASSDEAAIATTADGLVEGPTDDIVLLDAALRRLTPAGEDDTRWPSAGGTVAIHFITDGAVPRPLDRRVVVHSVFEPVSNVGITAFDVRPPMSAPERGRPPVVGEAYIEVANFAARAQKVRMSLTRGKAEISAREIQMAPGEAYRESVQIAGRGDAALRLRVEAADNALDADDEAFAWLERARPISVLVVGNQTQWLRPLLAGNPDVRAAYVTPAEYRAAGQDVTIFDRWTPAAPPREPALYFAPPPQAWLAAGPEERRPLWDTAGAHPVVLGVDPVTLRVDRARSYTRPGLLPLAASSRGTPLVYAEESAERRAVMVTFSAAESNLATAPAFPVLIANALEWLVHPIAAGGVRGPGLTPFSSAVARVVSPDGSTVPFIRAGAYQYAVLRTAGLYAVEGGGARSMLAVNAADPQRSNVARTSVKPTAVAAAGGLERAWWIGCAVAAFLLALAEWWTWQRRITV